MNNQLETLLQQWYKQRDDYQWLLATIVKTEGSSYRPSGAMMLFNDTGQQFGLVSGGCLESDLLKHARQCWQTGKAKRVQYDMREDGDLAWQLGIGCGGMVDLLLQPINPNNQYLCLPQVLESLKNDQSCSFSQPLNNETPTAVVNQEVAADWITHGLKPAPTVLVLGGGVDAQPVVELGARLGWKMWVNDPRARYARQVDFPTANKGSATDPAVLADHHVLDSVTAVIVMHHNVELDAKALSQLLRPELNHIGYIGLLGPRHRTDRVLVAAKLEYEEFNGRLANPIGLDLGGDLPESLALAMLSEIHAWLNNKSGQSISLDLSVTP